MFINQKRVKQYVHDNGKQLESETMAAVDQAVRLVLDRAIRNSGSFKRIRPLEVLHGLRAGQ